MFTENTKLAEIILANVRLLDVLPYLGIELGFGEKTAAQVCAERGISTPLLLLICNLHTRDDYAPQSSELRDIPIEGVVDFLHNAHSDYLEVRMPHIIESVLALAGPIVAGFCEKYRQEVVAHFNYEEEVVFPYIRSLLGGERPDYKISHYESHHSDIDAALEDLKNLIIKYLPADVSLERSRPVLFELFMFEDDLRKHTRLEEQILIPLVEQLDSRVPGGYAGVELTSRELQTLAALARGLSNKQIADLLHISTHTVISHRKNIIRKTGIKTAQGLTLYAFLNNLVSQEDLR